MDFLIMDSRDPRQGFGSMRRRLPTDSDLDRAMSEQVEAYWYNLSSPLKAFNPSDKVIHKPNMYADGLTLSGLLDGVGFEALRELGERYHNRRKHEERGANYEEYWYRIPADLVREHFNVYGYQHTGMDKRHYESPILISDSVHTSSQSETPKRRFEVTQHVYLTITRNMVKDASTGHMRPLRKAHINFNPNRFVSNDTLWEFEPVYVFIKDQLLPFLAKTWISRLDVNTDFLGNPDQIQLTENDDKRNTERLFPSHDTWYCKAFPDVQLVKYDKSVERLANTTNNGYMHAEELERLTELTGEKVSRIELRLKEYGLKRVINAHLQPRKTLWLVPKWLDIKYKFQVDGKRKQLSIKKFLNPLYRGELYDMMAKLPLVTDEIIQGTLDYGTRLYTHR